jgi:DNA-binding FadR family transcriptional regulator
MAELVAADLRRKILTGELQRGDSLTSESSLVDEYDVSRPTLREALRLLESQQLITVRRGSHRGPVVSVPDSAVTARAFSMLLQVRRGTLADIYEFRLIFEPAAVRLAAERATADDVAQMRALLEEERAARSDPVGFPEVAWRFHTAVVRVSGNVTMALVAETLEHISQRHAQAALLQWDDQAEQRNRAYRAHVRLVDLIEAADGAGAERFWTRHMTEVGKRVVADTEGLSIIELLD